MRYRLRTLVALTAIMPPLLAFAWFFATQPAFRDLSLMVIAMLGAILLMVVVAFGQRVEDVT